MNPVQTIEISLTLIYLAGMWQVFRKADLPGLYAVIPLLNVITLIRISDQPWWAIFFLLIPILNIFAYWKIMSGLGERFHKGLGFKIGLLFASPIFMACLGFGRSVYDDQLQS